MEDQGDKHSSSTPSIATDSETETWEVVHDRAEKTDDDDEENFQNKQENPKITIDKAESTHSLDEKVPSTDDGIEKEEIVCQESVSNEFSLKVGSRVEDASGDDLSDGISVISESEIECTDDHRPITPEEPKQELILKPPSAVCAVQHEPLPFFVNLRNFLDSNQLAAVAILAVCIAILGGMFCQLTMMFTSPSVTLPTCDANLICEQKVKDLERDNENLRIEVSILQKEIAAFQLNIDNKECPGGVEPPKQLGKRTKAALHGKKFKTKYDSFKRPPVAAGGEEDTIIHRPLINEMENEDPLNWNEYLEPLQNFWAPDQEQVLEEPTEKLSEPLDLDNFEPIKVTEVEAEADKTPTLNTDDEAPEGVDTEILNQGKNRANKKDFKQHDKKSKQFERRVDDRRDKVKDDNENHYDKKKEKRTKEFSGKEIHDVEEKSEKRTKEFSGEDQDDDEFKDKRKRPDGSGNDERLEKEGKKHDKKSYKKKSNYHENQYKDKHDTDHQKDQSGEKNHDKDQKYRQKEFRKSNKDESSEDSSKERRERSSGEKKHDKYNKKGKDSQEYQARNDKDWHENRMKNREKRRDLEKEDNWYMERKSNRERHREGRDKDSNWYIERNLERELLRSREPDSKERSK